MQHLFIDMNLHVIYINISQTLISLTLSVFMNSELRGSPNEKISASVNNKQYYIIFNLKIIFKAYFNILCVNQIKPV